MDDSSLVRLTNINTASTLHGYRRSAARLASSSKHPGGNRHVDSATHLGMRCQAGWSPYQTKTRRTRSAPTRVAAASTSCTPTGRRPRLRSGVPPCYLEADELAGLPAVERRDTQRARAESSTSWTRHVVRRPAIWARLPSPEPAAPDSPWVTLGARSQQRTTRQSTSQVRPQRGKIGRA